MLQTIPGWHTPKLMKLVLFADELLIMSMAATGLQQQLEAGQDFCSVKEHLLHVHNYGAQFPRKRVRHELMTRL